MQCRRDVRGFRDENYQRFETRKNSTEAVLPENVQGFHVELVETAMNSFAVVHDFEPDRVTMKMLAAVVGWYILKSKYDWLRHFRRILHLSRN